MPVKSVSVDQNEEGDLLGGWNSVVSVRGEGPD